MGDKMKDVNKILDILEELYPDARCELEYTTAFELLIATILSAQCTDVRVNIVTKELYKKYGILTSTEIQKFYIEVKSKSKNFEIVDDYLTYSIRNQLFEKQQKN